MKLGNFKLYNALQSTCSQRVRYTLHYKSISYSMEILDLFSGDQLKPEYLSINPNGVVPALVHDGKIVLDSSVIIEYLEDININHNPLRPAEPENAAKMRAMIRYFDEVAGPSVRIPSYNMAFLPHFQDLSEKLESSFSSRDIVGLKSDLNATWRLIDHSFGNMAIFNTSEGIVLFHCNAALERIRFEQLEYCFTNNDKKEGQSLLLPESIELDGISLI